jgi:PPOX class probable F420-dependent enzyme
VELPESARAILESGRLAHLVTLNRDGSPQVSCVWVGLEDGEIVSGHLGERQKLRNVRRDPRVTLSVEGREIQPPGLLQYLVVHGRARITEGGAAELLQELAYRYLGPDVRFPPVDDPPPGFVLRIRPERLAGIGPWASSN